MRRAVRLTESYALARVCSFPSWPEGPVGWGAWASDSCVHSSACKYVPGGNGADTISRWAVPSISGLPVSGPLALVLAAGFGGGLDGLGILPATGSMTPPGERLLLRGSGGGRREAPTATSRLRVCSWSGSSRFPPAHDVFDRLSLPMCCRNLLGTALNSVWEPARTPPRNHSSNLEGSGLGRGFHMSRTFSAAQESIAVISGSGSDNATTPEVGNAVESSSPERQSSPSDAAIDIWSSGGAPKETSGVPHSAEAPVQSNGSPAGCGVLEGWRTPLGEALTVILKSPLTLPDAVPPRVPERMPDRSRGRGTPPCLT